MAIPSSLKNAWNAFGHGTRAWALYQLLVGTPQWISAAVTFLATAGFGVVLPWAFISAATVYLLVTAAQFLRTIIANATPKIAAPTAQQIRPQQQQPALAQSPSAQEQPPQAPRYFPKEGERLFKALQQMHDLISGKLLSLTGPAHSTFYNAVHGIQGRSIPGGTPRPSRRLRRLEDLIALRTGIEGVKHDVEAVLKTDKRTWVELGALVAGVNSAPLNRRFQAYQQLLELDPMAIGPVEEDFLEEIQNYHGQMSALARRIAEKIDEVRSNTR
jgi:hypothetical protein